jgi:predicted dehydrogenase
MVAENYRFFPAERTVRRWIVEGRLGTPTTVTCIDRRAQPPADLKPWASSMPHPQLVEIAVHHFDSFRYLLGSRPVRVTACSFNPASSPYQTGAGTQAMLEMGGGAIVLYAGWLTAHRYEYELRIEGERGSLWTDRKRVWWRARGARFFRPVRVEASPDGHRYPRAGTTRLLDQFRDAVVSGRPPETVGRDNLWTIAMMEGAIRSARAAQPVAIDLPRPVLTRNGHGGVPA